jgi:hypothetical protein
MDSFLVDLLDSSREPADEVQVAVLAELVLQKFGTFLPPTRTEPVGRHEPAMLSRFG